MHLLGSIGAVMVMILMIPQLLGWWEQGITASQQKAVADHLVQVADATQQYINAHQGTLVGTTSANNGDEISVATLRNEGFLPAGFSDTNPWLQNYRIYLRQPQDNQLQAIILTYNGRNNETERFQNVTVPGAATLAGGPGGFMGTGLGGKTDGTLIGASEGWRINLAEVGIESPGAGHVGAVTWYSSSALGQDFLYRVSIPGLPELNQMQTNLDMTDHSINNIHDLQLTQRTISTESCANEDDDGRIFLDTERGLYVCRNRHLEIISDSGNSSHIKLATVAVNGQTISKPSCADSTDTEPVIFTSASLMEAGPEAPPMTAIQTWATNSGANAWQVHMRVQTLDTELTGSDSSGWVYPTADHGKIFVLTMCQKRDLN